MLISEATEGKREEVVEPQRSLELYIIRDQENQHRNKLPENTETKEDRKIIF